MAGGLINNPLTPPTPPCYNTSVCFPLVITNTTEVFDPATGAWTMGPSMPYNRAAHDQLLLPDGKLLITAGDGEALRLLCGCSLCPRGLSPRSGVHRCGTCRQRAACIDWRAAGAILQRSPVALCRQPGLPQHRAAPQ